MDTLEKVTANEGETAERREWLQVPTRCARPRFKDANVLDATTFLKNTTPHRVTHRIHMVPWFLRTLRLRGLRANRITVTVCSLERSRSSIRAVRYQTCEITGCCSTRLLSRLRLGAFRTWKYDASVPLLLHKPRHDGSTYFSLSSRLRLLGHIQTLF